MSTNKAKNKLNVNILHETWHFDKKRDIEQSPSLKPLSIRVYIDREKKTEPTKKNKSILAYSFFFFL